MNKYFRGVKAAFLLTLLFSLTCGYGNPVDRQLAEKVGVNFLKNNTDFSTLKDISDCSLVYEKAVETSQGQTVVCFYIFNVSEKGFVIVAGDDCAQPILGYSTEQCFDAANIPINMQSYLDEFQRNIQTAIEYHIESAPSTKQSWSDLKGGNFSTEKNTQFVDPLLTTTWSQSPYYNALCPTNENGQAIVGCVATAMGQILNYWEYPAVGIGTHEYEANFSEMGYDDYGTLFVDFSATTYQYDLMPDILTENSTSEEVNAVATLLYHCGVSVNMMYSSYQSGAYSNNVPEALSSHFDYHPSMLITYRDFYSLTEWQNMLKSDLDSGYPIYYSAADDYGNGAHAFVCDGYDNNNLFHFNWGWNGSGNGYFAIDALNVYYYSFNSTQMAVLNIMPNAVINEYAKAPDGFTATANPDNELKVDLQWTNPSQTVGGAPLTEIQSIEILRDNQLIHTINQPAVGEAMSWTDQTIPCFGKYLYNIYAVTEAGNGLKDTVEVAVGPSCEITVEMFDSYGDGWQGNKIIFINESDEEIDRIFLADGYETTVDVLLPEGTVNYVWGAGSYPEEDSFNIFDVNGNLLYQCENAENLSGTFFTFDCGNVVVCEPANNLTAQYENSMVELQWESPGQDVLSFDVYCNNEWIGNTENTSFQTNISEIGAVEYCVTANWIDCTSGETCTTIVITAIKDFDDSFTIYPNPAKNIINIQLPENFLSKSGEIELINTKGQTMIKQSLLENDFQINTENFLPGLYLLKLQNEKKCMTKQVLIYR